MNTAQANTEKNK